MLVIKSRAKKASEQAEAQAGLKAAEPATATD